MNNQQLVVSEKYARAYYRVFSSEITEHWYQELMVLDSIIKQSKSMREVLIISSLGYNNAAINHAFEQLFVLMSSIKILVDLLREHQRLFLLGYVIEALISLYRQRNNIAVFNINSSHELTQPQKAVIVNFLSQQIQAKIVGNYQIDPTLIAGIRLHNDSLLWEHSINQKLRKTEQLLIR